MVYKVKEGIIKERFSRITLVAIVMLFAFSISLGIFGLAGAAPKPSSNAGSIGKVNLDTEVSSWDVGDGQFNGEFVVAEGQGIELGLRAQERFVGPLDVTGDKGNRVGVYEASTGFSDAQERATWNYDWHVDLSNAKGNAAGKTLADYNLVLEQDFTNESLFGALGSDPVALPMPDICDTSTDTLCQQSWNPVFGNTDFDPEAEGTYNLRLVLTPKTFNGPPLAVTIQVNVSN